MAKYQVTLTKYETYEVEAEDMDSAGELACELCDDDDMAWLDPVDKINIEEIKEEQLYNCKTTCYATILAKSKEEAEVKMNNMFSQFRVLTRIETEAIS